MTTSESDQMIVCFKLFEWGVCGVRLLQGGSGGVSGATSGENHGLEAVA